MYAIYGNIYHQYTPFMLAYIPAPWILWVFIWLYTIHSCFTLVAIFGARSAFFGALFCRYRFHQPGFLEPDLAGSFHRVCWEITMKKPLENHRKMVV